MYQPQHGYIKGEADLAMTTMTMMGSAGHLLVSTEMEMVKVPLRG